MRQALALMGIGLLISMGLAGCTTANTSDVADVSSDNSSIKAKAAVKEAAPVTLPSGTYLRVALQDSLSTDKSSPGDRFNANLTEPVVVEGRTVLEKGSTVQGRIVDVQEPGRVKGVAMMKLVLTSVDRHGKAVPIQTQTYIGTAKSTKKKDATVIGGAAGVGAVVGAIAGGGKGAAEGAAIGGGAGTGVVLATKGEQLRYPPETHLRFTLSSPAQL